MIDVYRKVPQTYYWQPLFSPDGKKILYNERESTEHHESSVVIYDRTTQKQQSYVFDQPIDERNIRDICILDANETTVLFRGTGPKTAFDSTFELDIETGDIQCIEEQSTTFHATKLSPDGRRVVFGFSRGDTVGIKIIDLHEVK